MRRAAIQQDAVNVRAALRCAEAVTVRVAGRSMLPFLLPGTRVRLRRLRTPEPRVGDIVALAAGEQIILHRVVGIAADGVQTQGDSAARRDRPTERAALLGIASTIQSPLGVWLPAPASARLGSTLRHLHRTLLAGVAALGRLRRTW